jgi:replication-associated recombination protein RarA
MGRESGCDKRKTKIIRIYFNNHYGGKAVAVICIDELDKMHRHFQEKLLSFIESGHIKVEKMRKQYDFRPE